jgi:hypothetical protein
MTMPRLTLAALLLTACAGGSTASSATPAPSSAAPSPSIAPTANAPSVRVTAPSCAYGGSAPVATVFFDVDTDIALTGVTASLTLTDAGSGSSRGASSRGYESLTVSPPSRGLLDFSSQGTTPFDGTIAAHGSLRLAYATGIGEDPSSALATGPFGALEMHVTLHTNEGTFTATCATAEMLPSS